MTLTYNWGICRAVYRLPGVHRFWVQAQLPQNQRPTNKTTAKVLFLHKEMNQWIRTFRNPEIDSITHANQWEKMGKLDGFLLTYRKSYPHTKKMNIKHKGLGVKRMPISQRLLLRLLEFWRALCGRFLHPPRMAVEAGG